MPAGTTLQANASLAISDRRARLVQVRELARVRMVWRSSLRSSVIEVVIDTESSWIPRKVMAVAFVGVLFEFALELERS